MNNNKNIKNIIPRYTGTLNQLFAKKPSTRPASKEEKEDILKAVMGAALIHGENMSLPAHGVSSKDTSIYRHHEILRITQELSQRLAGSIIDNDFSAIDQIDGFDGIDLLKTYGGIEIDKLKTWFKDVYAAHTGLLHRDGTGGYWRNPALYKKQKPAVILDDEADLSAAIAASKRSLIEKRKELKPFIQFTELSGRKTHLEHYHIPGTGNCGFLAINKTRDEVASAVEVYFTNHASKEVGGLKDMLSGDLKESTVSNTSAERLISDEEIGNLFSRNPNAATKKASIKKITDRIRGNEYVAASILAICAKMFKFNLHTFTVDANGEAIWTAGFAQEDFKQTRTDNDILILSNGKAGVNAHYDLLVHPDQPYAAAKRERAAQLELECLGQNLDRSHLPVMPARDKGRLKSAAGGSTENPFKVIDRGRLKILQFKEKEYVFKGRLNGQWPLFGTYFSEFQQRNNHEVAVKEAFQRILESPESGATKADYKHFKEIFEPIVAESLRQIEAEKRAAGLGSSAREEKTDVASPYRYVGAVGETKEPEDRRPGRAGIIPALEQQRLNYATKLRIPKGDNTEDGLCSAFKIELQGTFAAMGENVVTQTLFGENHKTGHDYGKVGEAIFPLHYLLWLKEQIDSKEVYPGFVSLFRQEYNFAHEEMGHARVHDDKIEEFLTDAMLAFDAGYTSYSGIIKNGRLVNRADKRSDSTHYQFVFLVKIAENRFDAYVIDPTGIASDTPADQYPKQLKDFQDGKSKVILEPLLKIAREKRPTIVINAPAENVFPVGVQSGAMACGIGTINLMKFMSTLSRDKILNRQGLDQALRDFKIKYAPNQVVLIKNETEFGEKTVDLFFHLYGQFKEAKDVKEIPIEVQDRPQNQAALKNAYEDIALAYLQSSQAVST